jgi:hypothetical protein
LALVRLRRRSRGHHTPKSAEEFWRRAPIDGDDLDALRAFGATALGRRDGRATMATGWALFTRSVLDDEALTLLREGFATWRAGAGYDPALARRFLEQILGEALERSAAPDDPRTLSANGGGGPPTVYAEGVCWVAGELVELGVEPVMERLLYGYVTLAPSSCVPTTSMRWAIRYAQRHELPTPWP